MMEELRGRIRLEVVCRINHPAPSNSRRVSIPTFRKPDPAQVSKMSVYDAIKAPLCDLSDDNHNPLVIVSSPKKTTLEERVRMTIDEIAAKVVYGLCMTCVRTGQDHAMHKAKEDVL
jgi:trehalose-6-phosphatase